MTAQPESSVIMSNPAQRYTPVAREANAASEFAAVVGESKEIRYAIHMAQRVAATHVRAILLTGEAGTGKELLARCIHNASQHAAYPFISVNCASIPAPLLEKELFGTNPTRHDAARKTGMLELAEHGTVFLDEVGELPLGLQDRLLRTLEEYVIPTLSLGDELPVHCRVIAASKTRLDEAVSSGDFREGLYGRLSMLRIELPPLREREDDARLIAEHLLAETSRLRGVPQRSIGLDAAAILRAHRWPGNVRELKHVLERALTICDGPMIGAEHLPINQRRAGATAVRGPAAYGEIRIPADGKPLREIEREALELTLQMTEYNQSAAARLLDISRPTLLRKLRTFGLLRE